jgi:hypothetical protein
MKRSDIIGRGKAPTSRWHELYRQVAVTVLNQINDDVIVVLYKDSSSVRYPLGSVIIISKLPDI